MTIFFQLLFLQFFQAIAFFTRVPVPAWVFKKDVSLNASIWCLPVVGVVVGGVVYMAMGLALMASLPSGLVVLLGLGVGVVLTGGLHEDGLADFCDGLGVSGRERALEVMHDSVVGSFGVLALVFGFAWRAIALYELTRLGVGPLGALLMHVGARGMLAPFMRLPLARSSGLAVDVRSEVSGDDEARVPPWWGIACSLGLTLLILLWFLSPFQTALILGLGGAAGFGICLIALKRLGGLTGDVYGTIEQVLEMVIVGVLVVLLT